MEVRAAESPRGSRAESTSVRRIARALDGAVRGGRPESARGGARLARTLRSAMDRMWRDLSAHLENHRFLRLQVTAGSLSVAGRTVIRPRGTTGMTGTLLDAGGVVEIVFKQGLERDELERFVTALHRSPYGVEGAESLATLLWQSDLRRISFRCHDDFWVETAGREQFDFANVARPRADESAVDAGLGSIDSPSGHSEVFPEIDLDAPQTTLRRLLHADADERRAATVPLAEEAIQRMSELLVGVQLAEEDEATQALARTVLARVVDLQLQEQQLNLVVEVLRRLRTAATHPAARLTLEELASRICATHASWFDALLQDDVTRPAQVDAIRDILQLLGDAAVDPLWQQLQAEEDGEEQERLCRLLATTCADEPLPLLERVKEDSWEGARHVIAVLALVAGPRPLPYLSRWRRHADPRLRLEVVRALRANEEPTATTMLCDLLDDEDRRVRQTALWALSERRDPRALERLHHMIFDAPAFSERPADEREDYFRAYGRLADEEALKELNRLLEKRGWKDRAWIAELRRGAAQALSESHWPQARRLLEKHARSRDSRVRAICQGALQGLRETTTGTEEEHAD